MPNGKPGGDERIIGNLGFGARKLAQDNTILYGVNSFYDIDLENDHQKRQYRSRSKIGCT